VAEPLAIKRRRATQSDSSFDSLRREAIELIQHYSGDSWTDYNLHDPGITILEQLVYAITDLIYRSEFAVEDFLVDEDGRLDLEACSLRQAADIFPCRPTTVSDYRKLLLDAVPEIDNLWISAMPEDSGGYRGLYRLSVKLANWLDRQARETAIEHLRASYHAARNLCEDLGEIEVVENLEYALCASIEIGSERNPEDLLAEIYFACARRMARSISIAHYDQAEVGARSLDRLFEGPLTSHGFFFDEEMHAHQTEFLVSTLFATINSIDGVDHIEDLYLARGDERHYDRIAADGPGQAFDLLIPGRAEDLGVSLSINGRELPISMREVTARVEELKFRYYVSRSKAQDPSLLSDPITGVARPFERYYSIQNQFPVVYGINRYGVPESAAPDVRARARQLKAYLLIFEQLMANFLANLGAVGTLFSTRTEPRSSYALQSLDERQIHDLEAVYPRDPEAFLSHLIADFDDFDERKNRLLDYLLSIYGERFSQGSLRHFNYYYNSEELGGAILDKKIAFLNSIVELGRDRAAAPDYRAAAGGDQSGLSRRVATLLGFEQRPTQATTLALREQELELVSHDAYRQQTEGSDYYRLIDDPETETGTAGDFEQPPFTPPERGVSLQELRDRLAGILPLKASVLSAKLLRKGVRINRYRVGRPQSNSGYQLLFRIDDRVYWVLGSFADRSAAVRAANDLRSYLILLNQSCEGLHVVERILLRPQQQALGSPVDPERDDDFFSFRISAIFPCWTARCHDTEFRKLAEETLRLNTPAQIYPEIYWLDFEWMSEFELIYENWQALIRDPESLPADREFGARQIIDLLRAHRQTPERDQDGVR